MIDGNSSTLDWQRHPGDILVLPVGALEQHGAHLPLKVDILNAEHAARMVAEHFDAALLPAIPIGNSLEHGGFRGSFSFRPETLMQMIRDLADEAEAQNFRFLIVVSGHGGNFALGPVCRDINRANRKIRLLPVFPSEFCDPAKLESARRGVMDIHAGESETSRFLAIGGHLCAPLPSGPDSAAPAADWRRSDLNIFGVGHLNPDGFLGMPEAASFEKGEAILASIRRNLTAYLEDRIAKLRRSPRYCGQGGLAIRELRVGDLADLAALVERVGWNQLDAEWRLLIEASPSTAIGFAHQGRIVATAAALPYPGGPAWINMVIVDPDWRGGGLAARMLKELFARHGAAKPYKLDATPDGAKVYEKLGFQPESGFLRLSRIAAPPAGAPPAGIVPLDEADLAACRTADLAVFGCDRGALLDWLFRQSGRVALRTAAADGFLLSRPGRNFRQLGPLYAPDDAAALRLIDAAIAASGDAGLVIDVPDAKGGFLAGLAARGFTVKRPFLRMGLNCDRRENLDTLFAAAGPEFG